MGDLVQIKNSDMPPLRQSTEVVMGCPKFYVTVFIEGRKQPGGMESARGTQIHKVLAEYGAWCAHKGVSQDFDAFDRFARGVGPDAYQILMGMRDSYSVDFEHLFATEVPMALDDELNPTELTGPMESVIEGSGYPESYQGTLDILLVHRRDRHIGIDDAKSHPKPFLPEKTLQGKMYSLFALKHFPWAETVTFRLIFVRYKNLVREVNYSREQLPMLIDEVRSARARQQMIHDDYDAGRTIEAIGGAHCIYCPLLSNRSCPVAEYNPNMQLTMEERASFSLWYKAFNTVNNAVMRNHVQETGRNIVLKDYNGKSYVYGPTETKSKVYPLFKKNGKGILLDHNKVPIMPIIELLQDHAYANPKDTEWMGNLVISSTKLNSALGAKSRADLDQAMEDTADIVIKAPLKMSPPMDVVEDQPLLGELDEEYQGDEDTWSGEEY